MENKSLPAEILYIIANYEKGRIPSSVFWRKSYFISLAKSLDMMAILVKMLECEKTFSHDECKRIQDFINKNTGVIFGNNIDFYSACENADFSNCIYGEYDEIFKLMNGIISEIRNLLQSKGSQYKRKISYMLMAFHNLPRALVGERTFLDMAGKHISAQEAMKYAEPYLEIMKRNAKNNGE